VTLPKYRQLYNELHRDIVSGRVKSGERLPSEAELVRTFGTSRITVGRALRDLQREGLVERRPGSGTYVRPRRTAAQVTDSLTFGLLAPDLGRTEVLDPICRALTAAPAGRPHAVLWGAGGGEDAAFGNESCGVPRLAHAVTIQVSGREIGRHLRRRHDHQTRDLLGNKAHPAEPGPNQKVV